MTRERSFMTVREMTFTALMTVLIAVCSWVSIPVGGVPFTLQTFGVYCALSILGGKCGVMAVLVYLMLGAAGLPVFSHFTGGLGVLFGSTGGYIVGFLIIALLYLTAEKMFGDSFSLVHKVAVMLFGTVLCYAFGTAWFIIVYSKTGTIDLKTALSWCVIPFVIPDCAKLTAALLLSYRVKKYAVINKK